MMQPNNKLCLGLWALGNSQGFHSKTEPRDAKNIIKAAYQKGIRSFDTAFSYHNTNLLYSALKEIGVKTDSVEIFIKVMPYKTLGKKVEAELRALKCEKVKSILIHWPSDKGLYEALKAAEKLKDEGKAESIGISNFPPGITEKIQKDFLLSYCEIYSSPTLINMPAKGLKVLKYGIFSFGSLLRDDVPKDARNTLYYYQSPYYGTFLDLKDKIKEISEKKCISPKETLLSFAAYDNPERIIIGARKKEHLTDLNICELNEDEYLSIYEKSVKLSKGFSSDNIFCHNWKSQDTAL